jgi:hypothetical protein
MENPPDVADESLHHRNNRPARRKPKLRREICALRIGAGVRACGSRRRLGASEEHAPGRCMNPPPGRLRHEFQIKSTLDGILRPQTLTIFLSDVFCLT